jgi:excisionase family DNA binding protein
VDKLLYTVDEVMELTGLGRWKVYDVIRDGSLRSAKIGACRRIPADALRRFVADLTPEVGP